MRRGRGLRQRSGKRQREDEAMEALRRWRFAVDGDCVARHLWAETRVRCEGTHELDHIIPRGVRPDLRLDPRNVHRLCWAHHRWKTDNDAAAQALGLRLWSHEEPPPLPPGAVPPPLPMLQLLAEATTSSPEAAAHRYGELVELFG